MAYAREGAKVVCADLQPHSKEAEENFDFQGEVPPHLFFDYSPTNDLITHYGGKAAFFKVDIANAEEVESLVAKAVKRFGRLDMYVISSPRRRKFVRTIIADDFLADWSITREYAQKLKFQRPLLWVNRFISHLSLSTIRR
jgi:NAD(P)-dependent dehydrogenase (short-subunit alcohol dehydrogenase family)